MIVERVFPVDVDITTSSLGTVRERVVHHARPVLRIRAAAGSVENTYRWIGGASPY